MPLSAAEIEDNTIKLTSFIFFYLLLTTSIYEASGACETLVHSYVFFIFLRTKLCDNSIFIIIFVPNINILYE